MKKLFAVSMLFAVGAMAETMSGVISDAKCGASHAEKLNEACVKSCVKRGTPAVFVSGGKVYKISGDTKDKVTPLLGQKVKVDGTVSGETITITSIAADSGA